MRRSVTPEVKFMNAIESYHAHVYFDADTITKARALCETCRDKFGVEMGRVHERPVGPHPDWSCQLAFRPEQAGDVIGWLATNRDGLVVLVHPETGRPLEDHRDHAIWMGAVRPLDLSIFNK
jgi:aromatic ring-cleaving dioxygenase